MTTDLTAAVAEIKRVTKPNDPWESGDFGIAPAPIDDTIAVILNAVASGDLVLKADVDGLVEALNKMDVGQSQRPDHWDYRVMARSTARAALTAWENRNG